MTGQPACPGGAGNGQAALTWWDVLEEIRQARPRLDLATGQPLHDPRISATVASALAAAAAAPGIASRLACYSDLDGSPELRSAFAAMLSRSLGRAVTSSELLVVPGSQAALRSVQAVMRAAGRRLLYPAGLEYPGAFDEHPARPHSVGQPRWSADATVIDLQPASLDWDQVGAAIISQPHSPTGRVWPAGQLRQLRDDAARHDAWLVLDETFALPALPLQTGPVQLLDGPAVVHVYSFSKAGLAAERLGVIAAHPGIIAALRRELRANAIAASHLGQLLAAALLAEAARQGPQPRLGRLYRRRWQTLRGALGPAVAGGPGTAVARWQGGPFLWLSWHGGPDGIALFRALLRRGVAVTPGTALHAAGQPVRGIRIGLGAPPGSLEKAGALVNAAMRAAARAA
jgi:GntR family transcriptional regulator / MocR family aminotransferase